MAKHKPTRMCISCRQLFQKIDLCRLLDEDKHIIVDDTGKRSGRGAYLCKSKACFDKAIRERRLQMIFKRKIEDEEIKELQQKVLNMIENDVQTGLKKNSLNIDKKDRVQFETVPIQVKKINIENKDQPILSRAFRKVQIDKNNKH